MVKEQILPLLGRKIRDALGGCTGIDFECLQEIRIRIGQPLILMQNGREYLLDAGVEARDIKEIVEAACGYSGYAFEEEISRGYVTVSGGHRIGLAGTAVLSAKGIQTLKYISGLNIRIAHPMKGCAEQWKQYFYRESSLCHVLIISPPGCGKTTLLRDAIRLLSNGEGIRRGVTVGVVDERSEIAGTYRGIRTHDLGMRTDVLDGCPKTLGMEMLLRSMAPRILAVDEIGILDVSSIENALRCGCKVLATMHGENLKDFLEKPGFESLVREQVFERYIFLEQGELPGRVGKIYGQKFEILWEGQKCT